MSQYDRRQILSLTVGSFLSLTTGLPALAQKAQSTASRRVLNWDAFIDSIEQAARAQHEPHWNQTRYVRAIEALAATLDLADAAVAQRLREAHAMSRSRPAIEDLERRVSFQVSLITFEPGQVLPLHDHPRMTGVMTCAAGAVDVRRFHLSAIDERNRSCTLRDEGFVRMAPGVVSSLTAATHNVHGLRARTFSHIIDIFTPPYDPSRTREAREFRLTSPVLPTGEVTATILSKA